MHLIKNSVYLVGLFLFLSCSFTKVKEPEFKELSNIKIEKMGLSTSTLSMEAIYFNPNNWGMELTETDLDIFIDNSYLGHTRQKFRIRINKKSDFSIPVLLEVDSKKLLKNGLNLLTSEKVEVKAKGKVKIAKAGIEKSINVDYTGMHPVPKPALH